MCEMLKGRQMEQRRCENSRAFYVLLVQLLQNGTLDCDQVRVTRWTKPLQAYGC